MFREFRILELRTLSNNVTPSILRKNLISEAYTCDRILSVRHYLRIMIIGEDGGRKLF